VTETVLVTAVHLLDYTHGHVYMFHSNHHSIAGRGKVKQLTLGMRQHSWDEGNDGQAAAPQPVVPGSGFSGAADEAVDTDEDSGTVGL
jgi:hypothetical protein